MAFNLFSHKDSIALPQEKRQRLLLVVLVVTVIVTVAVLYFSFLRTPTPSPMPSIIDNGETIPGSQPGLQSQPTNLEDVIQKIEFDALFLKDQRFQDLKIYGEWPLRVDEIGRTNPFSPY